MIYAASYFEPENHHGVLVPISRSVPKALREAMEQNHPLHYLLAPPKDLLAAWKEWEDAYARSREPFPQKHHVEAYKEQYREHIRSVLPRIKNYLQALSPGKDETWLCWEKTGEFCHRNLAISLVEKFRSDCYGGMDIPRVEIEEVKPAIALPVKAEPAPSVGKFRLKGTNRDYELIEVLAGNMTQGPMAKLKTSSGGTAHWLVLQLEPSEAIVSQVAQRLMAGEGEESWREYFAKLFREDHRFLAQVCPSLRDSLVEHLRNLEEEEKAKAKAEAELALQR